MMRLSLALTVLALGATVMTAEANVKPELSLAESIKQMEAEVAALRAELEPFNRVRRLKAELGELRAQLAKAKGLKPVMATAAPKAPAKSVWKEKVKYEANHKGQTPFTVEGVDAYRVPRGNLVISFRQTKIYAQPGDKVTFPDGTTIVIEKCREFGSFNDPGTLILSPMPPAPKDAEGKKPFEPAPGSPNKK